MLLPRIDSAVEVFEMPGVVVVGLQWGDEGKGKVVDFLAAKADMVVRYQGGNNAGHTVVVGDEEFKLHLVPSGILYPGTLCVLGNGVVVNPGVLLDELAGLRRRGIDTSGLRISDRAHVIMPWHPIIDLAEEDQRGEWRLGTTGRGIGPAYIDKAQRYDGIRIAELVDPELLRRRLEAVLPFKNKILREVYGHSGFDPERVFREYSRYAETIAPMVCNGSASVYDALKAGKRVLFEGAQGTLLDLDHGTYPFVSSSSPTAGGAATGAGIGPTLLDRVVGVVKAYSTRVGEGPFPTELMGEECSLLREGRGREYGVTTGRPRRCGWFDGVVARHSVRVNGVDSVALTKLDVLDSFETIKICTAYRHRGRILNEFPASLEALAECEAVYEELPGWKQDTTNARRLEDLPANARAYVDFLAGWMDVRIAMVSVGWRRDETVVTDPIM